MLQRCFDPKLHEKHPTYAYCTVHPDWLYFSKFKAWMETQDWQGKSLDKDLISGASKHYSPDTCVFVSRLINSIFAFRTKDNNGLPVGVTRQTKKGINYFVATCCFYGKQKTLGYFRTPEEASQRYITAKLAYAKELAQTETDPRIVHALLNLNTDLLK
jgi:hypothetical protein